mmetsp:Transcript_14597/g.40568  ORF Transcript_14597/g.40568 Transcript_14597/m.40568 type:complete len:252 (-) Transcript_14597:323-1078(-)
MLGRRQKALLFLLLGGTALVEKAGLDRRFGQSLSLGSRIGSGRPGSDPLDAELAQCPQRRGLSLARFVQQLAQFLPLVFRGRFVGDSQCNGANSRFGRGSGSGLGLFLGCRLLLCHDWHGNFRHVFLLGLFRIVQAAKRCDLDGGLGRAQGNVGVLGLDRQHGQGRFDASKACLFTLECQVAFLDGRRKLQPERGFGGFRQSFHLCEFDLEGILFRRIDTANPPKGYLDGLYFLFAFLYLVTGFREGHGCY